MDTIKIWQKVLVKYHKAQIKKRLGAIKYTNQTSKAHKMYGQPKSVLFLEALWKLLITSF